MTDDDVTDDDLVVAEAVDEALASTEDELTDTAVALVTANGVTAGFERLLEALKGATLVSYDTPDERRLAAMLYQRLEPIEQIAKGHRRMIESSFRRLMVEEGATSTALGGDRFASLLTPDARYEVNEQGLYDGLKALVGTIITERQLEDAIHPEVRYVLNHAKLNALHKNMGAKVQAVIDANRTRIPGDPANGKVVIPRVTR